MLQRLFPDWRQVHQRTVLHNATGMIYNKTRRVARATIWVPISENLCRLETLGSASRRGFARSLLSTSRQNRCLAMPSRSLDRRGFTLIEVLVVVAIIA